MPQAGAETGIKVKEFGNKFKKRQGPLTQIRLPCFVSRPFSF